MYQLLGDGRGQLNRADLRSVTGHALTLVGGYVLSQLYAFVSTTDLGPNTAMYVVITASVLQLFRRFTQDNTRAAAAAAAQAAVKPAAR